MIPQQVFHEFGDMRWSYQNRVKMTRIKTYSFTNNQHLPLAQILFVSLHPQIEKTR